MNTPARLEVERPVVVGLLGTHSTGKTTWLARLAHLLRRQNIEVATVADLGEQAQRMGLPLLFNHTWASTLWIISRGISNELESWQHADVVLVDRAVPDALGYYRAALEYRDETIDPSISAYLDALVGGHSKNYDLLYRTALDVPHAVLAATSHDQALAHAAEFVTTRLVNVGAKL